MTPGMQLFSPMMLPYGSGLTPQPVQTTNSLSILEEQQRQQQQQQQQQQAQQANAGTITMKKCRRYFLHKLFMKYDLIFTKVTNVKHHVFLTDGHKPSVEV